MLEIGIDNPDMDYKHLESDGNKQKYCGTWGAISRPDFRQKEWKVYFNSQTSGNLFNKYYHRKLPILQYSGWDTVSGGDSPQLAFQICKDPDPKGGPAHNELQSPDGQYFFMTYGNCVSRGHEFIKTRDECITAAKSMDIATKNSHSRRIKMLMIVRRRMIF